MQKENLNISAKDGLKLYGQHWIPDREPDLAICILHGFGGHSGHYEEFSSYMTGKGHAVFGMDMRGHGKSEGRRGYIKSGDLLMSDIGNLLVEARRTYLGLPIILFGHSMGGLLAANYILKYRSSELTGVVITSPLFRLAFKPEDSTILFSKIISWFYPGYTLSYHADPGQLSSSKLSAAAMLQDPLIHNRVSYRLYQYFNRSGPWAVSHASMNNLPTLVMHGEKDRITSWEASRDFCTNAGAGTTFKLWQGFRHELHNDERKSEVLDYINDWISGVVNGRIE